MTWILLNMAEAVVGLALAPLVVLGYARILRLDGPPGRCLVLLAVIALVGAALARMGWWDVVRPILGLLDLLPLPGRSPLNGLINLWITSWTILGELAALAALFYTIPRCDRPRTWLGAPFWPPLREGWR